MKAISLSFMLAGCMAATASAQALIQHAAAVAGATVGTIGGKALSNAIDNTLGKAADVGSTAATATPGKTADTSVTVTKQAAPAPAPGALGTPAMKFAGKSSVPARTARRATDKPFFADEERSLPAPMIQTAALAPPPPTAEEFAKMKEGISRDEVYAALGTPSSHITIPDDGHLVEILTYSDGAQRIGTIRVDNGQVIAVSPVSPK